MKGSVSDFLQAVREASEVYSDTKGLDEGQDERRELALRLFEDVLLQTLHETAGEETVFDFPELVVTELIVRLDDEGFTTEEVRSFLSSIKTVDDED